MDGDRLLVKGSFRLRLLARSCVSGSEPIVNGYLYAL